MEKMVLGGYTFEWNLTESTIPLEQKAYSAVELYSGEAYFSWGTQIAGKQIALEWDWMKEDEFTQLVQLVRNDAQIVWNPQTGSTYNVEAVRLDGKYFTSSLLDANYRKDVKLELLIMSEV